jgi:hypothetical protein
VSGAVRPPMSLDELVQFIDIVSPEQIGCGLDGQRCALPTNPTAPASPTPN